MKETLMKVKSKCVPVLTSAIVLVGSATSCFAAEGDGVASSVGTSLEPVKTDAIAVLATVAPYGIAIMGGFLVWKYGIRFFKGIAK